MPNVNKLQVFNNEFFSLAASLDQIKASCKESSYFVNEATFQAKKRLALIGTHVRMRKSLRRFNAALDCFAGVIKANSFHFR